MATSSHQIWFCVEAVQREVPQAGVLRAPDPVLAPRPAAVAQFQVGELPGPGVGGEGGDAVPADVGEPQLRAGVGAFLADDHPHPGRPGRQVQQAGELGDPGAGPDLAAGVIGRFPDPVREGEDGLVHVLGDGHADRVVQAAARAGQPGQEVMRAAAGVGADQHPPPLAAGQLGQRQPGHLDVLGRGVRPGVARAAA